MEFKGLAEILDKFTFAQRILALLMLLMTIVIVTIGPKLIDSLTTSNTECIEETKRQSTRISYLEKVVDTLDDKIITNQRRFSNEIARRESEFIQMLDELKFDINKSKTKMNPRIYQVERREYDGNDGVGSSSDQPLAMERIQEPVRVEENGINSRKVDVIVKKIEALKKKVKKDSK